MVNMNAPYIPDFDTPSLFAEAWPAVAAGVLLIAAIPFLVLRFMKVRRQANRR
jgi:hypothetical protein